MSRESTSERRRLGRFAEYLIVAMILSIMVFVLLPAVRQVRNPDGPPGEMVPSVAPDETNRVWNASGLSIVLPENWEMKDFGDANSDSLYTYARGAPGRRTKALINVQPLGDISSLDLSTFTVMTFQGFPAYERMIVEREDTFDDPAWSSYTMYFQHEREWWVVDYGVARECRALPEVVRRYINAIRWDTKPSMTRGT
jgi:hypothetical protein